MQLRQPLQFVLVYNINKHVLICLFCNISVRLHCLGHFVHVNIYGNWTYHTCISFTISYIFVISVYFHNFQKLWCTSDAERSNSFCCVGNVPWMLSQRADSGRVLCRVQVDSDNINIGCNCMRLGYNFIFIINSFKVGSLYLYLAAPASKSVQFSLTTSM